MWYVITLILHFYSKYCEVVILSKKFHLFLQFNDSLFGYVWLSVIINFLIKQKFELYFKFQIHQLSFSRNYSMMFYDLPVFFIELFVYFLQSHTTFFMPLGIFWLNRPSVCPYEVNLERQVGFLCRLYGVVATYRDHFSVVCPSVTKLVRTTHKLLVQFHPPFTRMISTKSSCAYCQHFPVQWFL
jgi:hypothetical protein